MQLNQRDKNINGPQKLFFRKGVHTESSGESDDEEDVVQTTPSATRGSCGDLPPTNSQASTVDQPVPKLSRGKSIKPDSVTGRSGSRSILGCTAMIQSRECFASYVRSWEIHLLQPGVHGLSREFKLGTTQLSNSGSRASPNGTEML